MIDDRRATFERFEMKQPIETIQKIESMLGSMENVMEIDGESVPHSKEELGILYEIACGMHDVPNTEGYIIHCGMHRGSSLCVMGEALKRNRSMIKPVIGLDPYWNTAIHWNTMTADGSVTIQDRSKESEFLWNEAYRLLRENIKHFDLSFFVCPVIFSDLGFFEMFTLPARIIFIDTWHVYKHLKNEIEIILPNLNNNGWLIVHDYWQYHPGIIHALNEFLDTQTDYDITPYCWQYSDMEFGSLIMMRLKHK